MAAAQKPVIPAAACALAAALAVGSANAADETWKNWFDDPFFQVRAAVTNCPMPRGPLATEADMRKEAHARVERGTSCWLAGKCSRPNAYQYDTGIAAAIAERFAASRELARASLWVTVQRRIAWVEGCAAQAGAERRVAALLKGIPDLELVIVQVVRDPAGKVSYPTRPPAAR